MVTFLVKYSGIVYIILGYSTIIIITSLFICDFNDFIGIFTTSANIYKVHGNINDKKIFFVEKAIMKMKLKCCQKKMIRNLGRSSI